MSDEVASPIVTPGPGVDPRVALATSIHGAPGIYAAMVGSGMSSAAGILTGWQVVLDLVNRVARAQDVDLEAVGLMPDAWWTQTYGEPPAYGSVLKELAPTPAARQALLRPYFEPSGPGGEGRVPTAGHEALAQLAAAGGVRVILTTNFDRLIERALDGAGVSAAVVSATSGIPGMTPLQHSPVTVIKLHGDYTEIGMRNTPDELGQYPRQLRQLLRRVLDEYGLIVVGWSADWDSALARELVASPTRRYPTYWAVHNGYVSEAGRRVIAGRQAAEIPITNADEFLSDLVTRVDRLRISARRHTSPRRDRHYVMPPASNAPPSGWKILPLLQIRTTAILGHVDADDLQLIRPDDRRRIVSALDEAGISGLLWGFAAWADAADAATGNAVGKKVDVRGPWTPVMDNYSQSTDRALYRFGEDASDGISALCNVQLPGSSRMGSSPTVTLDVAFSLTTSLPSNVLANVIREGLLMVTTTVPDALGELLPPESQPERVEVHLMASNALGAANFRANNAVEDRIDFTQFGLASRSVGELMSFGYRVSGPLTSVQAAEVTAGGLEYALLANGYLDTTSGVAGLRRNLGLPVDVTQRP
ncbi:MAG TPA: SIR2 family protein [Mycobacteriales bacterium]|nr:SIR2 family protein [Mycobacteriales bacterium]